MKLDIFAVSDIHGHASIFKEALKNAGFEPDNPKHLLVVCGDYFDRGPENRAVYIYLDRIKNKVLIRGNHDDALDTIILNKKLTENDHHNGMSRTVSEFFRGDYFREYNCIYADETREGCRELLPFLGAMRDYFETKNYVFTHGWLPNDKDTSTMEAPIRPDWRYETPSSWYSARWEEWQRVYHYDSRLEGKTIVVGHRSASYGYKFDPKRSTMCYDPFHGDGMIAIDGLTVMSGQVNVLVIRDEEVPDPVLHEMKLLKLPFNEMKVGRKTVEMRLFDEKRKQIRVGDKIRFTCEDESDSFTVTVVGLHKFENFQALTKAILPKDLGFKDYSPSQICRYMTDIYTEEKVNEFGTLAIRVSLDKNIF